MGFRDLHAFNQALLAKQNWRLLTNPDSLPARIFKAKYYPYSNLMDASLGYKPSYVWRSILWGRELLSKGIRWRIASGKTVSIFTDPWLLRPWTFRPITLPYPHQQNMKVCELMLDSGDWNWQAIDSTLWHIDHEELRRIPVGLVDGEDTIVWHFTASGNYSVKSGYSLALSNMIDRSEGSHRGVEMFFRKLWGLHIPNKVKIHVWRAIHEALPTRMHLASRGLDVDILCPRCHQYPEHSFHVFWHCKWVQKVWQISALWPLLDRFKGNHFMDLWCWVVLHGQREDLEAFAMITWSLWIARNQLLFANLNITIQGVVDRAKRLWGEFASNQLDSSPHSHALIRQPRWCAPSTGKIKINVDAAVVEHSSSFGVGIVARDDHGVVLAAVARQISGNFSPHLAELYAIREGLLLAIRNQWQPCILEADALNAVTAVHACSPLSMEAPLITSIHKASLQCSDLSIMHCLRSANQVAHVLAKQGLQGWSSFDFVDSCPFVIGPFVKQDLFLL